MNTNLEMPHVSLGGKAGMLKIGDDLCPNLAIIYSLGFAWESRKGDPGTGT